MQAHCAPPPARVLLTDHAWPDTSIERDILQGAGFELQVMGAAPPSALQVEALVRQSAPAAILTCWAQVSATAISASPALRIVARLGIGLDNIAVDAATAQGVMVTNVPAYCVEEVSDHAVGMALAWTRGIVALDRQVRAGDWAPGQAQLRRLAQLTCGIVGYGRIGRRSAAKLRQGFGSRVLAYSRNPPAGDDSVEHVALEALLAQSDIVILHAPLTPDTRHLINRARLAKLRKGSLLINVSRGALVDNDALIEVLANGTLGGAALDVLETEPEVPEALRSDPRVILTPHVAFSSDASVAELRRSACEEVVRVLRGQPPLFPCNTPHNWNPAA
ncbi:MAG TPA: C-terminal binding protein [Burkholderiaceae bacterium]|nr:C-terminal binding protein [Burkholderiaceae bacterium]HQZ04288.1 C-terminal binding protein [Burkholderiaceae bacterium]